MKQYIFAALAALVALASIQAHADCTDPRTIPSFDSWPGAKRVAALNQYHQQCGAQIAADKAHTAASIADDSGPTPEQRKLLADAHMTETHADGKPCTKANPCHDTATLTEYWYDGMNWHRMTSYTRQTTGNTIPGG